MSETNAIKWLRAQNVSFDVLEYTFTKVGADLAAEAVGRPLEAVCKTLIVKATGRSFYVAIIPGDQRFDTRRMAAAMGVKEVELANHAEAEKITGTLCRDSHLDTQCWGFLSPGDAGRDSRRRFVQDKNLARAVLLCSLNSRFTTSLPTTSMHITH